MPLETLSKIDFNLQYKNQISFFIKTLILFLSIFFTFSPTLVLAACCTCNHLQVTAGQICITKELVSCNNLGSLNPDLKEATCTTETNATKCRLVKDGGICVNNPNTIVTSFKLSDLQPAPAPAGATASDSSSDFKPVLFKLNIDIPGTNFSSPSVQQGMLTVSYLNQYIQAFYKLLIGISLIAASIMIIYGGFRYIMSATAPTIQTGKQIIIDALMGLVIVLGAYVILANVNPNLTQFGSLTMPFIPPKPLETISPKTYKDAAKIAGTSANGSLDGMPSPTEVTDYAAEQARAKGIDPCVVYAIIMAESRGRFAVGHDENQYFGCGPGLLIQSRLDFMRSRKFYSGASFNSDVPIMPPDGSCVGAARTACCKTAAHPMDHTTTKDQQMKNDDSLDINSPPDYGLDWRFSHGIGIGQATIFPNSKRCPDGNRGFTSGGKCFTVPELLTIEGGVASILAHPSIKPGVSPKQIFCGYGGKSLNDCIESLIQNKINFYNDCPYK